MPGEPLPRFYYHDDEGNFVRADVTYLRQDFSVVHEIPDRGSDPWPKAQRFDYVTRTREATSGEIAAATALTAEGERTRDYPQRRAVMFAVENLWESIASDAAKQPVPVPSTQGN
ncbi:MAG TPA: hypothetical protein VG056_15250 [Pirellulales bacterium]|nr:hypothetical protein [Pirellulales bacterium]